MIATQDTDSALVGTEKRKAGTRRKYHDIKVQAKAQALFATGMTLTQVADKMGLSINTIKSWYNRGGWGATRAQVREPAEKAVVRVVQDKVEKSRELLGERLLSAVTAIGDPIGPEDLRNQGQGYAAVLKSLAETHRTLYGGAETNVLVFGVGSMGDTPQQVVVDIESAPVKPEQ